jgi:hypothetical protein
VTNVKTPKAAIGGYKHDNQGTQMLEPFNVDVFKKIENCRFAECKHWDGLRNSDDEVDIEGYALRVGFPEYESDVLVKACEQCAVEVADITIARGLVLLAGLTTMVKAALTRPENSESLSPFAKEVDTVARRAKKILGNINSIVEKGKLTDARVVLTNKSNTGLCFLPTNDVVELTKALLDKDIEFLCGAATAPDGKPAILTETDQVFGESSHVQVDARLIDDADAIVSTYRQHLLRAAH